MFACFLLLGPLLLQTLHLRRRLQRRVTSLCRMTPSAISCDECAASVASLQLGFIRFPWIGLEAGGLEFGGLLVFSPMSKPSSEPRGKVVQRSSYQNYAGLLVSSVSSFIQYNWSVLCMVLIQTLICVFCVQLVFCLLCIGPISLMVLGLHQGMPVVMRTRLHHPVGVLLLHSYISTGRQATQKEAGLKGRQTRTHIRCFCRP